MDEMFTANWMQKFKDEWNEEPDVFNELANINFNSAISYGFVDKEKPAGILIIEKGKVVTAAVYEHEEVDWDLRASKEDWQKWFDKSPGIMSLGLAYTSRRLKFNKGQYAAMIKDPRMAGPFIKSFEVMGRV